MVVNGPMLFTQNSSLYVLVLSYSHLYSFIIYTAKLLTCEHCLEKIRRMSMEIQMSLASNIQNLILVFVSILRKIIIFIV